MKIACLLLTLCIGLSGQAGATSPEKNIELATFAGGCFWCMEAPFEDQPGVLKVISGFSGGTIKNPAYKLVSSGKTKHIETVQIHFDPSKTTYQTLLDIYWRQIDPTDDQGSFVDRGRQYRPVIFFHNQQQLTLAQQSIEQLEISGRFPKPIVVELQTYDSFYAAEDDHQDYAKEHSVIYNYYRSRSGRDKYLNLIWGVKRNNPPKYSALVIDNANKKLLKQQLTKLQYKVTQLGKSEPSFNNEFWDNSQAGIYVDIVSGQALFSSKDQFKSGTGWPSFTKPISKTALVIEQDNGFFSSKVNVRSANANSYLGLLLDDGPVPSKQHFQINSSSLRFIGAKQLSQQGYGQFQSLFN